MQRRRAGLVALILLAGCSVGTKAKNYAPAQGPAGATVQLELAGKKALTGELLAVEESTLLVMAGGELIRVSVPSIQSGKAPKLSFTGTTLKNDVRNRLRLISRYPQGVSPELESRLLQAYGQTAVRDAS